MMLHRPLLCLMLTLCVGATTIPVPVRAAPGANKAGDEDLARRHFKQGVSLFKDGDYRSALFEFEAAYELSGNPQLLYNIAVSHDELHHYAAAIVAYEQYLERLGDELDAGRTQQVEAELKKLRRRVGTVMVDSDPSGAMVRSGDRILGVTPFEAPLDLGEVELEFEAEGYETQRHSVSVSGGERIPVDVTLRAVQRSSARLPDVETRTRTGDAETPRPERAQRLRVASLTTLGIAGATGVGAIIVGALAVGANNDLEDERGRATTRSNLDSLESRRDDLSLTTDVLIGVTAGLAVISLGLGLAHLRAKKKQREIARVQPGPLGVRVVF